MGSTRPLNFEGVTKFDGNYFGYWDMQIKDFLTCKKVHRALKERLASMSNEDWEALNEEAIANIRMCLSMDVACTVANETTAVKLMEALTNRYEKPTANNKAYLLKQYFNMQMDESASVNSYINEVTTLINQLKSVKIEFTDGVYAIQL